MANKIQMASSHFTGIVGYLKTLLDHVDTKSLQVTFEITEYQDKELKYYSVVGKQYLNKKEVKSGK